MRFPEQGVDFISSLSESRVMQDRRGRILVVV